MSLMSRFLGWVSHHGAPSFLQVVFSSCHSSHLLLLEEVFDVFGSLVGRTCQDMENRSGIMWGA